MSYLVAGTTSSLHKYAHIVFPGDRSVLETLKIRIRYIVSTLKFLFRLSVNHVNTFDYFQLSEDTCAASQTRQHRCRVCIYNENNMAHCCVDGESSCAFN